MRVSGVDAAFPMLPLHPDLWPFMLFRFFVDAADPALHLYVHVPHALRTRSVALRTHAIAVAVATFVVAAREHFCPTRIRAPSRNG